MGTDEDLERVEAFALEKAPPIPEGQRCENDRHMEVCVDGWLARHAVTCEACAVVLDPLAEEEWDARDDCPQCGAKRSLMDKGYIWIEEEPLASIPIFTVDHAKNQVCVTFFCEPCTVDTADLGEYIEDAGGWPTEDGGLVVPTHCQEG